MSTVNLTTALANAEKVYAQRTTLCINDNFESDEDLSHKATFESLEERINLLSLSTLSKDEKAKKTRLMVVLRLIYNVQNKPVANKPEGKGDVPKAIADLTKEAVAKCKAPTDVVAASATVLSPIERAKQIQKEMSIFLLSYDFFIYERERIEDGIKEVQTLNKFAISKEEAPLDVPEIFSLLLCFKVQYYLSALTGKDGGFFQTYSDKTYNKIVRLLDHPNPIVRNFAKKLCLSKKYLQEIQAKPDHNKLYGYIAYIHHILLNKKQNKEIVTRICPELLQIFAIFDSQQKIRGVTKAIDAELDQFNKSIDWSLFLQKYERLYEEYLQIQDKLRSFKKESLLTKHKNRIGDFFFPGSPRKEEFPTPSELQENLSKSKKTESIVSDSDDEKYIETLRKENCAKKASAKTKSKAKAKIKPQHGQGAKVSVEKQKSSKSSEKIEHSQDTLFVKKILQSRKFSAIVYDDRVTEWQIARSDLPSGFTPDSAYWKHAFTKIVDPFVGTAYSFKDVWKNPKTGKDDPCYCILADITFPSGETIQGVFQYTFDAKGVCYHRWFGKMSNIERLDKAITEKRHQIDFPPLAKAKAPSFEEVDNIVFEVDPYFDSITFNDEKNGLKIKIYKVEE